VGQHEANGSHSALDHVEVSDIQRKVIEDLCALLGLKIEEFCSDAVISYVESFFDNPAKIGTAVGFKLRKRFSLND
jgi:hypothetical protein